jgi:hypothetical protein
MGHKMEHTYPCKICLVVACCGIYCIEHFKFINWIADKIPSMTADQMKEYRESTPIHVARKISEFYNDDTRYAFANTWESGVPRYERFVKGSRIHVRP